MSEFNGTTIPSRFKGYVYSERSNALAGPFDAEDIATITTRDNSSDMYCVTRGNEIKKTVLSDINVINFQAFSNPFVNIDTPLTEEEKGVIISKTGQGFLYRGRFKSDPFAEPEIRAGVVQEPLFFRDSYLSIAETNNIHLGDEHNEKQIHRIDLKFHKNSCGHVSLYVQNEEGKTKGQYKGMIKEHMKVFTNLRGRSFKLCLMVATHNQYPWALREMSIGHLYGKSF